MKPKSLLVVPVLAGLFLAACAATIGLACFIGWVATRIELYQRLDHLRRFDGPVLVLAHRVLQRFGEGARLHQVTQSSTRGWRWRVIRPSGMRKNWSGIALTS